MRAQDVADGLGICADAFDSRDKVTAIALEENGVFCPVVVFIVLCPSFLQQLIVLGFGVQDETSFVSFQL